MKNILLVVLLLSSVLGAFAQAPEQISYQAVVRNSNNDLVTNQTVGVRISILKTTATGTAVYSERHTPTANNNGLISIDIGTGTSTSGNFSSIDWSNDKYFIKTETDPAGGTSYAITGTSQLLSVPYALHSKTAEGLVGGGELAYRAAIVPLTASRNVRTSDANNTIACTASATLTIAINFYTMKVGDVINLEAHNGAVLSIQAASGVSINYTSGGSATLESNPNNVRFGLLRKSGIDNYIISGQ